MGDARTATVGDGVETVRSGAGGAGPARRTLVVIDGAAVAVHPLPADGEVTIGRGSWCQIQIDHPSLSRTHVVLRLGATIALLDRGSANGTFLGGQRLSPDVAVELARNETFTAGDVALVVQEARARGDRARHPATAATARPSGRLTTGGDAILLDAAMRRLYDVATRVARGDIGVLIVGETGAGKEMLSEHVHRASPRASRPLVRINCAALTETLVESELFGHEKGAFTGAVRDRVGLLETADGGTAFLDEVGELSLPTQAKLLRVVEDGQLLPVGASTPRRIDVRFVAASNRDLEAEVAAGTFRRDLYFRLAGVVLEVPPLRQRPAEIEALAHGFLQRAAERIGAAARPLSSDALDALRAHAWPGNVRELRSAIERAVLVASGDAIEVADLGLRGEAARPETSPPVAASPEPRLSPEPIADIAAVAAGATTSERDRIIDALARAGGNQSRAAALLGMPRRTLVKRLVHHGIRRPRDP